MNKKRGSSYLIALTLVIAACGRESVATSEPQTTITAPPTTGPEASTAVPRATTTSMSESGSVLRPTGVTDSGFVTANVPEGWENLGSWAVLKGGENLPTSAFFAVWSVANIYTDRCQWRSAQLDPPVGSTVDDLATALADVWGSDSTAPTDVMLDGFAGKQMVLTVPTDIETTPTATSGFLFTDCDAQRFQSWVSSDGGHRWYQAPGQIARLWILDVDGVRLVIEASYAPETSLEDRAELLHIIDSIQIESE